ncbi:retrovirus-related pol polyprotein from transposon TNT 1-94 [Tanacetum coccineum]
MKAVFNQMETEDEQCSVDRNCVEIQKKELLIENDRLLEKIILQDIMYTAMHADVENKCVLPNDETLKYAEIEQSYIDEYSRCVELEDELSTKKDMVEKVVYNELSNRFARLENVDAPEFPAFFEINDLKAQLQAKNASINKLKEHIATLKGKSVYDCTVPINNLNVIALEMYKLDWQPLSPKLRKNREARVDYLKKTMEHADTLRDILEQARALKPLDNALDYACKFSTHIHELLVYVSATCPSSRNESEKLVSVMPVNKKKQVMFKEPSTSTSKTQKQVVQIILWYLDSGFSKHMTRHHSQLINFVRKFMGTVRFGNDQVVVIMGYGDYQIGNVTISRVYYVDGIGRNLFPVDQLCDFDLEVAFQKHICFVRDIEGVDLLMGSSGTNLYTLTLEDMIKSFMICLLSKASKTKAWLWYRRLCHLNFGTINQLAKQGLVRGLPKLKYEKDQLCFACSLGKSKKHTHKPKFKDTIQEKLYLLHMDLCGPMRIESINGKKYILVNMDDYSRFTWVKFLRSKDETSYFIIKFLKQVQVRLNATVRNIQTDNET